MKLLNNKINKMLRNLKQEANAYVLKNYYSSLFIWANITYKDKLYEENEKFKKVVVFSKEDFKSFFNKHKNRLYIDDDIDMWIRFYKKDKGDKKLTFVIKYEENDLYLTKEQKELFFENLNNSSFVNISYSFVIRPKNHLVYSKKLRSYIKFIKFIGGRNFKVEEIF